MLQAFTKRFCLLTVVMLLSVVNALAQDVIQIGTVEQLKDFRDAVNNKEDFFAGKTVLLTADLDLKGENWTPIGFENREYSFLGIFDGNNHTISNLTINQSGNVGLFYHLRGTIKNLTLADVNITGTYQTGAFAAYCPGLGTIENCHVIGGTITSTPELINGEYDNGNNVGGIIGNMDTSVSKWETNASSIKDCSVKNVTIRAYRRIGGIAGLAQTSSAENGKTTSITGCTVENVTIIQDNTHNYKNYTQDSDYKIGELVGQKGVIIEENNNTNVTIKMRQIFDETTYVAQIDDVKYETLAAAFAAATSGETITLIADCELTEVLTNTKNVTLDLGTFAIYGTIEDFMIQNKGTLVINADETNPGKIYNTILANQRGPVRNLAEGTITINGGIFGDNDADPTNVGTVNGGYGFHNLGTATINGGIFTTGDPEYVTAPTRWAYAVTNGDGETTTAQLTINGGKVYGKHGDIANNSGTLIVNDVTTFGTAQYYNFYVITGDVTVNGGTYVKQAGQNNIHVYADDATASVTVKGGTFTKNTINSAFAGGKGTVALMGGTYNKQPEAKVVAAGYEAVANGNGTWTVSPAAVAQIGDKQYASLEEAFAAAQDGQTIKLLANCSGNGIIAPQGKFATGLTVDFGGFTYTVDGSTLAGSAGTKTQAFQLLKDNKITFTNGAIVGNTADVKMLIQNYSDLTLSYMTLDATQGTNSVNYVLSTNNGNTVINHTTITAKDNGKAFDVDSGWGNYESNSVELMGQSVINGDIEVAFEGKTAGTPSVLKLTVGTLNGNIVMGTGANKCTVIKGTYFAAAAPEGYEWKYNDADTRILKAIEYINDVTDGETVVATETATITNGEATITNVEIEQEGVKNVTVSAAINSADVTEIAEGAFASLAESAVQTIDLSSTKVALEGERSENPVLKDIPATALVYLPSTSNKVTGTNVVIKDADSEEYTCNDFQMLDEQDYSVPTPFTATTATLTRSFTADLHCTVCLPYDVPKENINGSIYRYTAFNAATTTIEMTQDIDGLDANVPYIFVPNSGTSSISASNIEVKMKTPQTTQGNFTFKGVFEEKHFTEDEYNAGIYGYAGENKFNFSQGAFYKLGINAYVPAMRAYLVSNSVAGAPAANGVKAAQSLPTKILVVLKNADGETTDILHFDMETAEDDAPVYNLNGQRVNHAEKGVYIKNGKKVIIK